MSAIARLYGVSVWASIVVFFFQAEDGIRDLVRSRGLGDVYKRQRPDPGRAVLAVHLKVGRNKSAPFRQDLLNCPCRNLSLIHI